jgi:acyl-[acyl-carrier-protein] desaturase
MIQERATYANYQELRLRVRREYGLPDRPTAEERDRRCEVGASEVLRLIAQDEIAHHGIFLKLIQIYLRHAPELTLQKLDEVIEGFNMPALRLIPNRREFIRTVARTGLHDADVHREKVSMPVLRALGLDGESGLRHRRTSDSVREETV